MIMPERFVAPDERSGGSTGDDRTSGTGNDPNSDARIANADAGSGKHRADMSRRRPMGAAAGEHPAIRRLRAEFDAAREGISEIDELAEPTRDRVVASIRTGLPDIAGRAAHEVGTDAAVAEIRRFAVPDLRTPATTATTVGPGRVASLWRQIVADATAAALAAAD
jgi:hypothetical protein